MPARAGLLDGALFGPTVDFVLGPYSTALTELAAKVGGYS